MGDCLKRSFEAGLRWCGINDSVPNITTSDEAKELSEKYCLVWKRNVTIKGNNDPVIVIYRDDSNMTDSDYHAVFVSDIAPFVKWEIYAVITGFQELRKFGT